MRSQNDGRNDITLVDASTESREDPSNDAAPEEYEVPGHWQSAGEATWLVPANFDPDHPAVQGWLFTMGDWRLYRAPKYAEGRSPDVFRCTAAELLAWMNAHEVHALIESFHDDTDWVVALSMA